MKTYESEIKQRQECITIKTLGIYITNIYVSTQLETGTNLITKIPNNPAHLTTVDIKTKHRMIGVNDLHTNKTGNIVEQWLDGENFI